MTFEQQWIEYDYNPFILFSKEGKVISINKEAQYLLGEVDSRVIFDLATTYASTSFGFKTTIIDLEYTNNKFFAILVGYDSEDEIGIKLYKSRRRQFNPIQDIGESANIYTLLDLCISASSQMKEAKFVKDFDPTLPHIKLHISNFTKMITNIYNACIDSKEIKTSLFLKTGEVIRFENKKYPIFSISISADNGIEFVQDSKNEQLANSLNCMIQSDHNSVSLAFPLIIA